MSPNNNETVPVVNKNILHANVRSGFSPQLPNMIVFATCVLLSGKDALKKWLPISMVKDECVVKIAEGLVLRTMAGVAMLTVSQTREEEWRWR